MYLRVQLPDVTVPKVAGGVTTGFRWLDWVGHVLVKTVELEIGGQKVELLIDNYYYPINSLVGFQKHSALVQSCAA